MSCALELCTVSNYLNDDMRLQAFFFNYYLSPKVFWCVTSVLPVPCCYWLALEHLLLLLFRYTFFPWMYCSNEEKILIFQISFPQPYFWFSEAWLMHYTCWPLAPPNRDTWGQICMITKKMKWACRCCGRYYFAIMLHSVLHGTTFNNHIPCF